MKVAVKMVLALTGILFTVSSTGYTGEPSVSAITNGVILSPPPLTWEIFNGGMDWDIRIEESFEEVEIVSAEAVELQSKTEEQKKTKQKENSIFVQLGLQNKMTSPEMQALGHLDGNAGVSWSRSRSKLNMRSFSTQKNRSVSVKNRSEKIKKSQVTKPHVVIKIIWHNHSGKDISLVNKKVNLKVGGKIVEMRPNKDDEFVEIKGNRPRVEMQYRAEIDQAELLNLVRVGTEMTIDIEGSNAVTCNAYFKEDVQKSEDLVGKYRQIRDRCFVCTIRGAYGGAQGEYYVTKVGPEGGHRLTTVADFTRSFSRLYKKEFTAVGALILMVDSENGWREFLPECVISSDTDIIIYPLSEGNKNTFRAALSGNADAQYKVSQFFSDEGCLIPDEDIRAYWRMKAIAGGSKLAKKDPESLSDLFSKAEELEKGRKKSMAAKLYQEAYNLDKGFVVDYVLRAGTPFAVEKVIELKTAEDDTKFRLYVRAYKLSRDTQKEEYGWSVISLGKSLGEKIWHDKEANDKMMFRYFEEMGEVVKAMPIEQCNKKRRNALVADACIDIGLCFYKGRGTKQSYEEAVKWWEKAKDFANGEKSIRGKVKNMMIDLADNDANLKKHNDFKELMRKLNDR